MRDSLIEALAQGIGATAKVSWLTRVSRPPTRLEVPHLSDDASIGTTDETIEGKARWIHCTPLTGSDGKVGVIMIVIIDKQDTNHSPSVSTPPSTRSMAGTIGPVPAHARAKSHASFRSEHTTPERWTPRERSSPSSAIKERPSMEGSRRSMDITVGHSITPPGPARRESISDAPTHRRGGSRLYADWMNEIRKAGKRADSFSTKLREHKAHDSALGSMARAVEVTSVQGPGRAKKIGGTF